MGDYGGEELTGGVVGSGNFGKLALGTEGGRAALQAGLHCLGAVESAGAAILSEEGEALGALGPIGGVSGAGATAREEGLTGSAVGEVSGWKESRVTLVAEVGEGTLLAVGDCAG